jgi:N-acetyl-1-D-myo-inositol-2-amino-2-deoxy-alpha-D-glucopyranoside deacetylase
MTVHAHPDDEVIGTGGTMALYAKAGRRVVLVTCTRGEMGEIVVPELDTPENHRRLGEIRAAELEAAMAALGVTEWENLGYRDSDMMGRPGNCDARCFWQANIDEAIGRLVFLVRTCRPDVMTTYNEFGGYGHPDHIRTHLVAVGAFARAGDPAWYPHQLAPEHGGTGAAAADGGLSPWAPAKLYEQAIPASVRRAMQERMEEIGERSFWTPPQDATPEQVAEFEAFAARMLVPDDAITAWVDVSDVLDRRWEAIRAHVTQISDENPFVRFGPDAWAEYWNREAFVRRETRVAAPAHETDLFTGIDGSAPGPFGWGREAELAAAGGAEVGAP